ncbi:MAG: Cna B-type domain-containing protein [Firmicutes bacterium]|nr:Cna B-type domain-containing protein [Bacillota bacterium]
MEEEATEEDPYVLVFQIGTTWKDTPAAIANMISYYTESSSWVGMFSMQYDGKEISQMQGVTLEDGAYHGKVIYFGELSDVTTQMTFSTGDYLGDDVYPLYARVTLLTPAPYPNPDGRIMSGPFPYISTTTVKVNRDGTIEATLKDIANDFTRNLLAYTSTPTNLVVQLFKDEACTEQLDDWRMASNHSGEYNQNGADHIFRVTIDSDNHLRMYTTSQICKPLFEKEATVFKPAVKVAAIDQGGFADSSAFPLYAKVKLTAEHEGETTELEQVVAINSPISTYDRAQYTDVSFDGYIHKEATITIEYDLYKDEACTEKAEGWKYYSPLEYVSYYADEGKLSDDELIFTYNLTSLDFDVEAYSSLPQEDYPAYVKVTLTTFDENSDPQHEYTQVLPFTGNDRKTAAFTDVDRGAWSSAMLSYAVYTDADCTTPHAYWSEETVWNGYIQEKGGFWSYDEEMVKDTIGLSHVATKSLTVPMDTQLGNIAESAAFPVYLKVTLSGNGNTPVTVTREIRSLEQANEAVTINAAEGESFASSQYGAYTLSFAFYEDAQMTAESALWPSGSFPGDVTKNQTLTYNGDAAGLHFRPLAVTVDPEAFELTVDSANPIYVMVIAGTENGREQQWSGSRTDLESFTVDLACLGYATPYVNQVNMGEHWTVGAGVCADATYSSPDPQWTIDRQDTVVTVNDGLQIEKETRTAAMDSWGGTYYISTYEYTDVILRPVYSKKKVSTSLNVHVNVPETNSTPFLWRLADPGYNWQTKYDEALHLLLYRSGGDGYYQYWEDDRNSQYGESHHWISIGEMDENYRASYPLGDLEPGTYYLGWFMGAATEYRNPYKPDPQWIAQTDPVKIIVTEDGRILDEQGNAYTAEVYMKEDYKNGVLNPFIDVEFTPSEDFDYNMYDSANYYAYNCDAINPYCVEYTLKPLWENAGEEFTYKSQIYINDLREFMNGRSYISTNEDYRRYRYSKRICAWMETDRLTYSNYTTNAKNVYVGWPVGDYELSYGVVDIYRSNGSAQEAVQGYSRAWYKDTVNVHLAEDGKIYKIKEDGSYEDDPYYIDVRYLNEEEQVPNRVFDYVTVKVNTTIQDGITPEQAFSDDETFRVTLCMYRWNAGDYARSSEFVGYGDAKISETGETIVKIYGKDGGPIELPDDSQYEVYYGTYTSIEEINGKPYPIYSNRWTADFRDWPLIDDEGILYYTEHNYDDNTDTRVDLVLENKSLLVPWDTVDPQEVSQGKEGPVFKPVTSFGQFKDKGNYIVVVQNQYDKNWYALCYDENGGHQILLKDVSSLEDLKNGYVLDENSGKGGFVLTASKVKQADDSLSLQLKSNAKGTDGKAMALKMGTSSSELYPLFSSSAGTVIVRNMYGDDPQAPTFQIWKGGYAVLNYVHELFGQSGFGTIHYSSGGGYYTYYPAVGYDGADFIISQDYMYMYGPGYYSTDTRYGYIGQKPSLDASYYDGVPEAIYGLPGDDRYLYLPDDDDYTTDAYKQAYLTYLNGMYAMGNYYLPPKSDQYSSYAPDSINYYILTDVEEETPSEENNTYTLVKTFGDFFNTFVERGGTSASMLLVYKDAEGNEYALNPKGAVKVQSKEAGNGYNRIIAGAENEFIPDNNSGTSSTFGYSLTDVVGSGEQVFANSYALRKSRLNNATVDYVTLSGGAGASAWTPKDDAEHGDGLVYVMQPTSRVYSQSDWDTVETYKLRVIRYGETSWLALEKDENGKLQMVTTSDEQAAAVLYVYAPVMTRYYSSAYGSDFYRYYRVYNLEEINAGDELLIVYNDGEKRHLLAYSASETSGGPSAEYGWSSPFAYPALDVLDSYSTINIGDDTIPLNARYMYRMDTEGQEKKPYAYFDADYGDLIWAQGVASNAVGTAKKETKTQRKYESVTPLGNQLLHLYVKTEKYPVYHREKGEVNFLPGDERGQFVIRGGKSDAYLCQTSYNKYALNLETGRYDNTQKVLSFDTFSTTQGHEPTQFEIYRKSNTDKVFTIEYYTPDKELEQTALRPQDSITLIQHEDIKDDDTDYIFVGWTPDPDKAGLLPLNSSANLFDYDDTAKRASVKPEYLKQYSLLGDCDPDADNIVSYDSIKDYVKDDVLKLYPVYAVKGFSSAVTANEEDTMIIGITDVKDQQMGGDGTPSEEERWLGSIDVQIFLDGAPWVANSGMGKLNAGRPRNPLGTGRRPLQAPEIDPASTKLYFAYHNDDAADLNIKFIADTVTAAMLQEYMQSPDFTAPEPTNRYRVDAVYAEQGGSEDGLKYRYNWLDPVYGGQLDNVKGGSVVKVFVTTKYQVKYYLDKNDGNGYQLLTGETWTNPNFYTTAGTEDAIKEIATGDEVDYVVTTENEYNKLINKDLSDNATFKDEAIKRGEYSEFLYTFDNWPHVIPIAELPDESMIPAGSVLEDDQWTIRDQDLKQITKWAPSTDLTVTETTYGTGNSAWSYKGEELADITNTYHLYIKVRSDENTEITITKVWNDADNQDGLRLTATEFAAKLHLLANGEEVQDVEPEVTDNGDGTYTVTYTDLPKNADGGEIIYSVKEDAIDGYEADKTEAADGETITNNHEPEGSTTVPETTEVEITKVWEDADNQDGLRPSAEEFVAKLHLFADEKEVEDAEPAVTENGDGTYTVKYTELPKNDETSDALITYTVKEDAVDGYEADRVEAANGETITNTHEPATTEVEITKAWEDADNKDELRPTAAEFAAKLHLLADGKEVKDAKPEVTDNEDGTYSVKYADLPKNADGKAITYTVKEDAVDGYEADQAEAADGETITNTHEPEEEIPPTPETTKVEITKAWQDADNKDELRPTAAEFAAKLHLLADGEEVKDAKPEVTDNGDGTYTVKYQELPKLAEEKEIVYTVKEDTIDGYEADKTEVADGETITNTHEPEEEVPPAPETVDVKGTKTWDDVDDQDGIRPDSIIVNLLADGEKVDSITVTAADDWKFAFTDLPKYDEADREIQYTVTEDVVEGYETSIEGFNITNTHKPEEEIPPAPETIEITGTKTWDDANDKDGIRPDSITVRLFADGKEAGSVKVTAADGWKYSFKDLPKFDEAEREIKYTITEDAVKGYEAAIKGYDIVNTHKPKEDVPPTPDKPSKPEKPSSPTPTGDRNNLTLWIGCGAAALAALIALLVRRRKREN